AAAQASTAAQEVDAGYSAAFPRLYSRAYSAAFRLLGNRAHAQDIAQETMARAYVRWSKITGEPAGWCVRVAVNLAMDHLRTAARDRRRHRELTTVGQSATHDAYAAERVDLYVALRALPRRQRQIVALRYIGDLSEQQAADALHLSVGTVKSQSSRGLAALRTQLAATATASVH
ncbi:MAG: hypothetical protein QOG49_58, partial [Frankiaceae bacterium]|nr:hypothetical protein [Frankiaceae bacterium]